MPNRVFLCAALLPVLHAGAGQPPPARVADLGAGPGDRYALCSVFDPKSRSLLAWGGETNIHQDGRFARFVFHDDFRVFRPGSTGWSTLAVKGAKPSARAYAGMALAAKQRRIYLFGGFDPKFRNDLWEFSLDRSKWKKLQPKGPVPGVRDAMGCTFDEETQTLWIFGGLTSFQPMRATSDLWKWELASGRWTRIAPGDGPWPAPRFLSAFCAIGKGRALLYGGYAASGRGVFGDLWQLDLKAGTWKQLAKPPAPRAAAASVWNPSLRKLVVLNGIERADTDSIQLYDPETMRWTQAGGTGVAKSYAAAACDPNSGAVYLLGGVIGGFFGRHAPNTLLEISFAAPRAPHHPVK